MNLASRTKVTTDSSKIFSARIWEINEEFYRNTGLRVADIENNDFMLASGAEESDKIEKYCKRMKALLGAEK